MKCPSCEIARVATEWVDHTFDYDGTELSVLVPMRKCEGCGETYLDHQGEELIQNVIDIHRSPVIIDEESPT